MHKHDHSLQCFKVLSLVHKDHHCLMPFMKVLKSHTVGHCLCILFAINRSWFMITFLILILHVNFVSFMLCFVYLQAVLTDDIMYCVLTILYNVILDPELAKRFRIVITQRLFDYFVRNDDIGIRCLIKFSISYIHMLLSKSEVIQVCIDVVEANLLAKCLNGVDSFFGGYDSLMLTIENLARNPKHQQIFVDCGIVSILKSLVLNHGLNVDRRIFHVLLHLIPEPNTSLQQVEEEIIFPICNSVTKMLTSDPLFMDILRKSDEDLCKGLLLLLCPFDVTLSGIAIVLALYTVVCNVAKEAGKPYNEYIDMQKENIIFSHM